MTKTRYTWGDFFPVITLVVVGLVVTVILWFRPVPTTEEQQETIPCKVIGEFSEFSKGKLKRKLMLDCDGKLEEVVSDEYDIGDIIEFPIN